MFEINVENITFNYGKQKVLEDINFKAERGDFICILGPSGCGKSTFLRLVAGLNSPGSGTISINGKGITGPGLDRGVVFQDYSLFPWFTALQNVSLALKQAFPDKTKVEIREIAAEYLELVGLSGSLNKLPKQLSGGMKQRAAIAQVFAINPPVLLMDEPFGALDAINRVHLQDILLTLWGQNKSDRKTIIFVTHDVDEALLLSNKVIVFTLNPGRIRTIVPVDLPRPRNRAKLHSSSEFHELRDKILSLLNESILNELDAEKFPLSGGDMI
jgi:NitT/TauT family transport system ATP-binding protein